MLFKLCLLKWSVLDCSLNCHNAQAWVCKIAIVWGHLERYLQLAVGAIAAGFEAVSPCTEHLGHRNIPALPLKLRLLHQKQTVFVVEKFLSFLLQHSALAFTPEISGLSGGSEISSLVLWQGCWLSLFHIRSCLSQNLNAGFVWGFCLLWNLDIIMFKMSKR